MNRKPGDRIFSLRRWREFKEWITRRKWAQGEVDATNATLEEQVRQPTAELARANALITALAQVAARVQTTADLDQVMETLGVELKPPGITCFFALPADGRSLVVRYASLESETLALAEKSTGVKTRIAGTAFARRWSCRPAYRL